MTTESDSPHEYLTDLRHGDFSSTQEYQKAYQAQYRRQQFIAKHGHTPEEFPCRDCGTFQVKEGAKWKCPQCEAEKVAAEQARKDSYQKQLEQWKIEKERKQEAGRKIVEAKIQQRLEREERTRANKARIALMDLLTSDFVLTGGDIYRFWERVDRSQDCWVWSGAFENKKPIFNFQDKDTPAYRIAYFLLHGPPQHKRFTRGCDNPKCVNPAHLVEMDFEAIKREAAEFRAKHASVNGACKPIPDITEEIEARFRSHVDTSAECHLWLGTKEEDGYGKFNIRQLAFPAHRVAYKIHYGSIDDTLQVHHSCDSPFCVRGEHLSQGDNLLNVEDSMNRLRIGHNPFLSRMFIPNAKQVEDIKLLLSVGMKPKVLSRKFGVSLGIIGRIEKGTYQCPA